MEKNKYCRSPEDGGVRKGPWTVEEDTILIKHIADHGEGVWNNLAKASGLKRNGKSCRLRWLNYLRPDIRKGNITPQERLLIMDLHAKWGNRWSKIAKHLPGRSDNEIKNFCRGKNQKHKKEADHSFGAAAMNEQDIGTSQVTSCNISYPMATTNHYSTSNYLSVEDFWDMQSINGD